jgi:ABC-2 type transport system ATP-binding protein
LKSPLLKFENVSKSFGAIQAVQKVSFSVMPGEIVALLGNNGAGKTTLISLASGALQPTKGVVKVFERDPTDFKVKENRRVLPQELSFPKNLTVEEIVSVVCAHYSKRALTEIMEKLDLLSLGSRAAGLLSGGEKRKLALVCSLAGDPSLVILDEPTANVDIIGRNSIHQILKEKFTGQEAAFVFSSHEMAEVEKLATRVIVICSGQIVFDGSIQQIKNRNTQKKVRFRTLVETPQLASAAHLKKIQQNTFECLGVNSDVILRELIENKTLNAFDFELLEPTLDESIIDLWKPHSGVQP